MSSQPIAILLVEDNPVDARLIRSLLRSGSEAYAVDEAGSLAEGLTAARARPHDLVLVDLFLPDSKGLETLSVFTEVLDGVPIIVLTADENEGTAHEAVAGGAQDFLSKAGLDGARLRRSVRYALERHRLDRERFSMERELAQARKLEAIGQLAAGIAHEINTPTQYVSDNSRFLRDSFAELLTALREIERLTSERGSLDRDALAAIFGKADVEYLLGEIPRALEQSLEGLARITRIVRAMKEFSHPASEEKTLTDLNHALETTLVVASNEWKYVAEAVTDLDPALPPIACLPGEINQVLLNLVVNAAHAIAEVVGDSDGKGRITLSSRLLPDGGAELRIGDSGCGIRPEHHERIFEPFFTTKDVGRGTGQGLALAYDVIVHKHGGTIQFQSEVGAGTTFVVTLPAASPLEATAPA